MVTQRITSIVVTGLLAGALVTATSSVAQAQTEKLSPAEYAETVCDALGGAPKAAGDVIAGRIQTLTLPNFAADAQEAAALGTTSQTAWSSAAVTLETVAPDVSSGKKISKLFVDYANAVAEELQAEIDEFNAALSSGTSYLGAITVYGVALIGAAPQLGNPVVKISDRNVRRAFEREAACEGLFPEIVPTGKVDPKLEITEFDVPTADATTFDVATGADGNVWFTEVNKNQIGKVDVETGQVTEYPGLAGGSTRNIVAGSDGNLWFTTSVTKLGKVDPASGAVTEVALGTAIAQNITSGPDGNIWITDQINNQIAKVDVETGVLTAYPIPTPSFRPRSITSDDDGNLWFSGGITNLIGKLDPETGAVTTVSVPESTNGSSGIVASPDGNIWYTTVSGSLVKKLDPKTEKVTEFRTPTPSAAPFEMVMGCDGKVWFTEETGNRVGNVDLDKELLTEYVLPGDDSEPFGLVIGPDGNLWFTEQVGIKIGTLDLNISKKAKSGKAFKECVELPKK